MLILQILQNAWKVINLNYGQFFLNVGGMACHMGSFIVLKLANVNN